MREQEPGYKLEAFLLAMWNLVGEDGTKNFGLHMTPKAAAALMRDFPSHRRKTKDGRRVIDTAMGEVTLYEDR